MAGALLVAAGLRTLAGDPNALPPRALLVEGDRITWTGSDAAEAPPHDTVADLGDAWVTPAFVDAHVHATATGLSLTGVALDGCGSAAELLDRVRRHAAEARPAGGDDGPPIIGAGWDDFGWPDPRPTAADIAAEAPGRTVLLLRADGHSCLVDPATLAALPLASLEGVDRDRDGAPTGWLKEAASEAAQGRFRGLLTADQLTAARLGTCAAAARLGIATLHEMGHPGLSGLDDARAWADGAWPVEVLTWWAELDLDVARRHGLRPGGDLFLDGSIGSSTAAVSTPYGPERSTGTLFHDDAAVTEWFTACTRAGLGAGVHAIGDRAIEQALGAISAAADASGVEAVRKCRHRVEHLELPSRDQVRRMAHLGIVASVQPAFDAVWGGDDGLYADRFGVAAARRSNPLAWFSQEGVALAFSSDSTVTPLDPWGGVVAAGAHKGGLGLPRSASLAAHTLGGRYVAGQDDIGPLQPGYRADLAVWDSDPFAVSDPRTLSCLATVVAGRCAHGSIDGLPS